MSVSVRMAWGALVLAVTPAWAASPTPAYLEQVEVLTAEIGSKGASFRVIASGAFQFSSFSLADPPRFVIDLEGVLNRGQRAAVAVGGDFVRQIRTAQNRVEPIPLTRVVFDLRAESSPQVERHNNSLLVRFAGSSPSSGAPARPPPATPRPLARSRAQLQAIDLIPGEGETIVQLIAAGELSHSAFALADPDRFVLDLEGTVNRHSLNNLTGAGPVIERVRLGEHSVGAVPTTRVVFDLKDAASPHIEAHERGLTLRFEHPIATTTEVAEAAVPAAQPSRSLRKAAPSSAPQVVEQVEPLPSLPAVTPEPPLTRETTESSETTAGAGPARLDTLGEGDGEWLVMVDGSRIPISGRWRVKGETVIFTRANGTLSSLRLSEVDLEATAVAAEEPPAERPAAIRGAPDEPVLILTDSDVGHFHNLPTARPTARAQQGTGGAADRYSSNTKGVAVAAWRQVNDREGEGVAIFGTLRNQGNEAANRVQLTVVLLDEAGKVIGSDQASITSRRLAPGATANFRASFPNLKEFASVEFDVKTRTSDAS